MSTKSMTKDQSGNPYEPTKEELEGETYAACYGSSGFMILPPIEEKPNEHY